VICAISAGRVRMIQHIILGEPVVDRHAGVARELLYVLLAAAAVLDPVEHPAEHSRGVGDRLLVAQLEAARVEVGDARALVERGDLERTARSSRALLEDQRDLLARQALRLVAGVLGRLERLRETQEMESSSRLNSISLSKLRLRKLYTATPRARSGRSCNASRRGRGRALSRRSR
jgi:hypothetical protein